MIEIDYAKMGKISSISKSESDIFSDLVQLAGLNPSSDFQSSRLSGVDFEGSDLSDFNFDYADLRGVQWKGVLSEPNSFKFAMRGKVVNEVAGRDFESLAAVIGSNAPWGERFFSFQILVDNWGENPDTAHLLLGILEFKKQTYLPLCCFVYFFSSYFHDPVLMNFCESMANAGRSQFNIYKIRRLRESVLQYRGLLENFSSESRYPGDLTRREISMIIRALDEADAMNS